MGDKVGYSMKYISKHVSRMQAIDRLPRGFWLWNSLRSGTFVKKIHGDLLKGLTNEGKKMQSR